MCITRPRTLRSSLPSCDLDSGESSQREREGRRQPSQKKKEVTMRAWTLVVLLPSLSLAFDECLTPTLENGWIEAAPGSGPESFVGRFRCREGFLLSGESRVKCRAGVWSQATLPVCTALMACPEEQLPSIENGYRRGVAKLQNSVYRFPNCCYGCTTAKPLPDILGTPGI